METTTTTMSLRQYARHHGVSPPAVAKWRESGAIVMVGDRVDVVASDKLLAERPEVYRGGIARGRGRTLKPAAPGRKPSAMSRAVVRKEEALASLRELDLAIKRGKFCDIEITGRLVEQDYTLVRERALTIPGKIADSIAMRDRQTCFEILQAEIREMLEDLHEPAEIARQAAEEAKNGAKK